MAEGTVFEFVIRASIKTKQVGVNEHDARKRVLKSIKDGQYNYNIRKHIIVDHGKPIDTVVDKYKWFKDYKPQILTPIYKPYCVVATAPPDSQVRGISVHIYEPTGRNNPKDGYEYEYKGDR